MIKAAFVGFGEVNTPADIIVRKCKAAAESLEKAGLDLISVYPVTDDYEEKDIKKAIAALENQVERYEKELDAKSEEIKRLQARIHELETVTTIIRYDDPEKEYPFPIGTAEPGIEKDSVRV